MKKAYLLVALLCLFSCDKSPSLIARGGDGHGHEDGHEHHEEHHDHHDHDHDHHHHDDNWDDDEWNGENDERHRWWLL